MPVTGLDKYESLVRVPDFGGVLSQEDYVSNQASHYQEHFASQIVLRRLSADFHTVLGSSKPLATCWLLQPFQGAMAIGHFNQVG